MRNRALNRKYSRISGLDELRKERDRLDAKLDMVELELAYDMNDVRNMFSLGNIMDMVSSRFSGVGMLIDGISGGYALVSSLINGRKNRKCGKK